MAGPVALADGVFREGGATNIVGGDYGGGTWLNPGLFADYGLIWRTQPEVRKVVSFLARNIAQLVLHVYRKIDEHDRERLSDHPLAVLLRRPLGRQVKMSRHLLLETLISDRAIYDNAYWLKVRTGDGRMGVMPIPPERVSPVGQTWLWADAYRVTGPRAVRTFDASQMVHFRGYNAGDRRVGLSPIETLRQVLLEEYAAEHSRLELWERGARISGVLQRPAGAPQWSDKARERFMTDWNAAWTGLGDEAGGTAVLEEGMTFEPTTFTAAQAQWLEGRKLNREIVASAYHIPPPMVGILDHATYSNISEQHKQLYQDTLTTWTSDVEEDVELQLLPDLDSSDDVYCEFNMAEKLRGDFTETARAIQTLVGAPVMVRNEARALLNLRSLPPEIGDQIITPLNVLIGGQASPSDSAPDTLPAGDAAGAQAAVAATVKAYLERAERTNTARAAAGRPAVPAARWVAELTADLGAAGLALPAAEEIAESIVAGTA
jgi:HK97 family phage portal protein